jgi:hypothetical protein
MPDLSIPLLDPLEPVQCLACGWTGIWQDADLVVHDFCARLDLSGRAPTGECPTCHDLISFTRANNSLTEHGLSYSARKLLPLFYDLHQQLMELRELGVLTESSIGEHWPILSASLEKISIQQHEALVTELKRMLSES